MSNIPQDLLYSKTHEWLRKNPDGTFTIGITDYAQAALGDITFIQLPAVGTHLAAAQNFGAVESVKAASDLYSPVAGTVTAINEALNNNPEIVNQSPDTDGWMLTLKPDTPSEADQLLTPAAYTQHTA